MNNMKKQRRKQTAAVQGGPVLAALLIFGILAVAGIGYLRLQQQIRELAKDRLAFEESLTDLQAERKTLQQKLDGLRSPASLEQKVKSLRLDLAAPEPHQILVLAEPIPGAAAPIRPDAPPRHPLKTREEQYAQHLVGEARR